VTFVIVPHSFPEGDSSDETSTLWHCVKKINHLRLCQETMAYNPAFHACSAIVDIFVIVCFHVEKHCIPRYALTNKLSLCLFKLMFWSRWLLFWVW